MYDAYEVRFPHDFPDIEKHMDFEYNLRLADDAMYNLRLGILNLVNSNVDQGCWNRLMKELEEAAYKLVGQERNVRAKDVVNAIVKGFDDGEESKIPNTVPCPVSVKIPQAPKIPVFGTMHCEVCNEPNEFAEPNMPNGKYRCYGHR